MHALSAAGATAEEIAAGLKLNIGAGKALKPGYVNIDIVPGEGILEADVTKLIPAPNESASLVEATRLPSLVGSNAGFAKEAFRVLKPGGEVSLTAVGGFGPAAVKAFEEAGFKDVQVAGYGLKATK